MQKIAVNDCYGGFSVSEAVYNELGIPWDDYGYLSNEDLGIESNNYYKWRTDPRLIAAIEKLGLEAASGGMAEIRIAEVPDDVDWLIEEYDGIEHVAERHRIW